VAAATAADAQHSDEEAGWSKLLAAESGELGGEGGFLLRVSLSSSAAASERTAALSENKSNVSVSDKFINIRILAVPHWKPLSYNMTSLLHIIVAAATTKITTLLKHTYRGASEMEKPFDWSSVIL
jgi:hypothetical protein